MVDGTSGPLCEATEDTCDCIEGYYFDDDMQDCVREYTFLDICLNGNPNDQSGQNCQNLSELKQQLNHD